MLSEGNIGGTASTDSISGFDTARTALLQVVRGSILRILPVLAVLRGSVLRILSIYTASISAASAGTTASTRRTKYS